MFTPALNDLNFTEKSNQQRLIKITLSNFNAVHNSLAPKNMQDR